MGRAPFQVLVLPFRLTGSGEVEYAVLRRADDDSWQGIAGGGEDDETIVEAARREASEEAAVPAESTLYQLTMQDFVPVTCFEGAREEWPPDTYLVPQYFFACDATGLELGVSREHTEIGWMSYDRACALIRYESNKTGLWELSERLRMHDLPPASGRQ